MISYHTIQEKSKRGRAWLIAALVILFTLIAYQFPTPVKAAGTNCITRTPPGGTYTVAPCITGPVDGATISGAQVVTASYTATGANPGVSKYIYYLNGQYLITDWQNPSSFTLPSTRSQPT